MVERQVGQRIMKNENDDDPFSGSQADQRVTPWVWVALLISVPCGLFVGFRGGNKYEVGAVILGPVMLTMVVEHYLRLQGRERGSAAQEPQAHSFGDLSAAWFVAQGLAARRYVVSMSALLLAVGVAIGTTWLEAAWLATIVGAALAYFLRAHRGQSGLRAALAFVGIPLAIYGMLVGILQWLR